MQYFLYLCRLNYYMQKCRHTLEYEKDYHTYHWIALR